VYKVKKTHIYIKTVKNICQEDGRDLTKIKMTNQNLQVIKK
jgi:ribosomal protein L20A (L18A)